LLCFRDKKVVGAFSCAASSVDILCYADVGESRVHQHAASSHDMQARWHVRDRVNLLAVRPFTRRNRGKRRVLLLDSALTKVPPCGTYLELHGRANAITSRVPKRRPRRPARVRADRRTKRSPNWTDLVGSIYGLWSALQSCRTTLLSTKCGTAAFSIIFFLNG
jgi:hypothetical protein